MDLLSTFIRTGAVVTGIGRIAIRESVTASRFFLASSLGLIATDYLLSYAHSPQPVKMVGALTFGTMFCRSMLLTTQWGQNNAKGIAGGAFVVGSALTVASQIFSRTVSPSLALSLSGLGFGCLADYQESMAQRRACFFAMGVCSMGFALASGSWPLFVTNLATDVLANSYFIYKYDIGSKQSSPSYSLKTRAKLYLKSLRR